MPCLPSPLQLDRARLLHIVIVGGGPTGEHMQLWGAEHLQLHQEPAYLRLPWLSCWHVLMCSAALLISRFLMGHRRR